MQENNQLSLLNLLYIWEGYVDWKHVRAILASLFNATFVNTVYVIIAILALILMFIKVKPTTQETKSKPCYLL